MPAREAPGLDHGQSSARGTRLAQGVPLDVADDCHKVVVILDRKRLESTLPDVAAVAVVLNVASDVSVQQPLHPAREVAIGVRSDHEVEVVGHEAIRQQPHW